jgi:hypothetical protein
MLGSFAVAYTVNSKCIVRMFDFNEEPVHKIGTFIRRAEQ